MFSQQSYFDALCVCDYLSAKLGSAALAEIHLFSYFSCLLALYEERPVSEWGYSFAVTQDGYPYSPDLNEAVDKLKAGGALVVDTEGYLALSAYGNEELIWLRSLTLFQKREPYIAGACGSVLLLPVGSIRHALVEESSIRSAVRLSRSELVPTDIGIDLLYRQFTALNEAIKVRVEDLLVPASVWLSYLMSKSPKVQG